MFTSSVKELQSKTELGVQSLSHVQLFVTPSTAACQDSLSFAIPQSLLKLLSIELMMSSKHLILCHLLLFLPSVFPGIRVFSKELALHIRWPKFWNFSFSPSPSKRYSGLISFRIYWFDPPAVQGTLRSLLQHHNLKAWILSCLAFFMVQPSHPYMTTTKTIVLTMQTLSAKWCLCFFNMLSRFVIDFLPRTKWHLISWWQSLSLVI